MERLLNIREAAEFLNVSEMTVRRWTNKGALKCYRVGGRRARRFKPQDLLVYLEGPAVSGDPTLVSLGFNGFKVPDGSHITHLSTDPQESADVAAAFIVEGLTQGDTVWVVTPDAETLKVIASVQERQPDVESFRKAGRLHFSRGMETPKDQARFIAELARRPGERFRIFGDMTWTKARGWVSKDLRDLEETVAMTAATTKGMLFLCQYKLAGFSGEEALMAVETHSHSIYRGALAKNPYHR
ncbi:MAG: MEDS domain-containing protein [Desulfobacterales bacterium]